MFESVCHPLLCSVKRFELNSLEDYSTGIKTIDLRDRKTVKFGDLDSVEFTDDKNYIPEPKIFESVDSILSPNIMAFHGFENHPVELKRVANKLECQWRVTDIFCCTHGQGPRIH